MPETNTLYRQLYKTGIIAYPVLFILAAIFYKERTVFVDIAYHLFHILKDGDFAIQNNRFGAVFTQLFPLICGKLSVPLGTTMFIYSAGFVIYYFTCYLVCGSLLKQYEIALCLLLFNTLFVTDTFYWIQSELPQGGAFMFVMFALMKRMSDTKEYKLWYLIIIPVILLAVFFHPILWIPAVYITLFFAFNNTIIVNKQLFLGIAVLFFIAYYLKQQFVVSSYDSNASKGSNNLIYLFPNWINLATNRVFLKECTGNFIWIPICTAAITIVYIIKRSWLNLLLFTGFMCAYLLLVNTTYPHGDTPAFYMENLYLPLGIFIAFPFVYHVLPLLQTRKLAYPVLIVIIACAAVRMYINHDVYTARLNWEREFLKKNGEEKLLIACEKSLEDTLMMTWGTPYEFWLLSTVENRKTASISIVYNEDKSAWASDNKKGFITTWGEVPYSALPRRYFILTDTVTSYKVVK